MQPKAATEKFGLRRDTVNQINAVFAQYPEIEQVLIYGSRAKGDYRKGSDIDLTIVGASFTYRQLIRVGTEIDDLLLPYLMDLSLFSHIDNPDLIDHIQRVGKVFYQRQIEPTQEGV